jgi:translocation and assembly module TamA
MAQDTLVVTLAGVTQAMESKINATLSLLQYKKQALSSALRMRILYSQGATQIKAALKPFGYYQARVTARLTYNQNAHLWHATYTVTPGVQMHIAVVNVYILGPGKHNNTLLNVVKDSPLQTGKPFLYSEYNTLKTDLQNTAQAEGFFDAKLTAHQVRIESDENRATIKLTLQSGPQYFLSTTHFVQHGYPFDPAFLKRFVSYQNNSAYHDDKITNLHNRLSLSNYFNSVTISPDPNKASHHVPVTVTVHAKKPQGYTLGAGYGTATGARALLGWQLRHITPTGQHFGVQAQISQIYTRFLATYTIPGTDPLNDYTQIQAQRTYTNVTPYDARETAFGLHRTYLYSHHIQTTYGMQEQWIHYQTTATDTKVHYLIPSLMIRYHNAYQDGFYKAGLLSTVTLQGAMKNAFSSQGFVKGMLSALWSFPFTHENRFFWSMNTGAISTPDLAALSPTLRFFAGGVQSVRGYGYLTLGPSTATNSLSGGRYLLTNSFNLEQHLYKQLSGVVFFDVGNAFNTWAHPHFQSGAGVGLSYQTPIGPISLYLSRPLNVPGHYYRVDFSLGAHF